jgi:internalin A
MAKQKRSLWQRLPGDPSLTVFLSYSHRDGRHYAEALTKALMANGIVVFRHNDIFAGERWVDRLQEELTRADAVIFIGTPASIQSQYTEHEVRFSRERNTFIIPIVFRDLTDFSHIPLHLRDIQWLQEDGSALEKGPSERGLAEILRSLQRFGETPRPLPARREGVRRKHKRPLNEGKLILVGRGEVGKTSLVRRLTQDEFRGDESKTQGINITTWPLACPNDTIRLNVWDFGGQEIMHATHQFFLTERSIYLLVLNGREGGEDLDAEYWLKHIASFGGESPVIVVQNKIAQHPFELNYRGLQATFPFIRAFVRTDCKETIGLDSLRQAIQRVVGNMQEVRMPFPTDWFTVKERLESMNDDFMSYDRFRDLCHEQGIEDESDRATLSWVLHCLGIALNYRDDSRLRETSVLKPEWVTHGIYRILNATKVSERRGELHLNDLAQLLPTRQYPLNKHHFLLEIMRKFSLCFAFPDDTDHYLIPELLGKEEPEETCRFIPTECLNFEYHYGVLPEGLIPRFIVRSHPLSRDQERWRSGVILAHEDCKALVKANALDRKVVIRVTGEDSGSRRRLLAIIRYDLDRINAEFRDRLDAQQKVPLNEAPEFCVDYKKLVAFEKQGVEEFPEFIGQRVVTVHVGELLNGVDLDSQRREPLDSVVPAKAVFFSYSHKDETLRDELETHLKLLQRQGVISTWHDRRILPGSEWDHEIDHHLERAKIILLLVSADFIASNYCWEKEVEVAMRRHNEREAVVIPVMLRACDWNSAPFARLQGLPREMKPVTTWADRDAAWTDVAKGIRAVAEML